jgi:5-formyltetrahydrofolate cyclo-ligase
VKLPAFRGAETVALFSALPYEPNLWPLIEEAWVGKKRVVLPRIVSLNRPATEPPRLHWFEISSLADLEPTLLSNGRTLLEPKTCLKEVPLAEIACLFVPGVAFDRAGWRLGRGGGYYDYALAQLAVGARSISHPGVMFACQQVDHLPTEPHDRRLASVLTENGLEHFPGN